MPHDRLIHISIAYQVNMSFIYAIDLIGTFVFAISGVMTAVNKKFDVVGATIIGTVTAIGGGSIRDILIGETPVSWMKDMNYLIVIFASIPICYFFQKAIRKLRKGIFIFDTIGIALFTIIGLEKTLALGLSPIIAALMGIVSAVFGGIIRDVLTNEIPLIFRKEIYATACLAGAIVYLVLQSGWPHFRHNMFIAIAVVFVIRYFAVKRHWALPFNPKT